MGLIAETHGIIIIIIIVIIVIIKFNKETTYSFHQSHHPAPHREDQIWRQVH